MLFRIHSFKLISQMYCTLPWKHTSASEVLSGGLPSRCCEGNEDPVKKKKAEWQGSLRPWDQEMEAALREEEREGD